MKKKLLLLTVLVMVFVCLLAISTSAETVISENNIGENNDIVADVLSDLGDYQHLLSVDISYTDTNGQTKNGKFYYQTSYWTGSNMRQVKTVYVPADFDFSQMIYFFDKADYNGNGEYAGTELTKLTEGGGGFKIYSYTSYENGTFTDTANIITSIQRVSYSKYFVKMADKGFGSKAPKLTTITYNGREPIEGALIISPLIDEIFGGSFGGDGGSETSNSIVTPFTKLILEDRETSVSFGTYCFTRNIIEEIYFGKGTYYLGSKEKIALLFGSDYANGEGATLKTVVLHKDAVISSGEISWNVGSYDVVVLGKESECKEYYEANHQSKLPCAKSVTYDPCYYGHTNEADDFDCTTEQKCLVCDGIVVEKFESHDFSTSSCLDDAVCQREGCNFEVTSTFTEHKIVKTMEYANGFNKNGVYNCICENAEYCTVIDGYALNETKNPIITFKGYSFPEKEESLAINVGYQVDYTLLNEYEKVTGEAVTLSLFMVNSQKTGENDTKTNISAIFKNDNLDFADGVKGFCVQVNKSSYSSISLTIKGFDKGENYDGSYYALRLISAVVVQTTKDTVTKTHYVQATLDTTDTITLNDFDFVIITASAVYKDPIPTVTE